MLEKMMYSYKGLCIKQKCVYLYEKPTEQEYQCSEIFLRKSRGGKNEFFLDKRIRKYGKDFRNHAKEKEIQLGFALEPEVQSVLCRMHADIGLLRRACVLG